MLGSSYLPFSVSSTRARKKTSEHFVLIVHTVFFSCSLYKHLLRYHFKESCWCLAPTTKSRIKPIAAAYFHTENWLFSYFPSATGLDVRLKLLYWQIFANSTQVKMNISSLSLCFFDATQICHSARQWDPQWAFMECQFQLIKFSGICLAHGVTGSHNSTGICRLSVKF